MRTRCNFCNVAQQSLRNFCMTTVYNAKNHYDSLGITPQATQKDVKDAYYKLSKLYHPDKNEGSEEASKKFRQVSEAYEVLGNIKLRKLYDRGASNLGKRAQYSEREDPMARFHRSRERRTRPPPPSGSTPIYDFDEWSRAHYGTTFARDMYYRDMVHRQRTARHQNTINVKIERTLFFIATAFFICIMMSGLNDSDTVTYNNSKNTKRPND